MREILDIPVDAILPAPGDILVQMGLPADADPGPAGEMGVAAERILRDLLTPRGLLADIDPADFAAIYPGRGDNAPRTPLGAIHPRADRLALFAVTAGPAVCAEIKALFAAHEYPLAAALDAGASLSADAAAAWAQEIFAGRCDSDAGVLRYSPGYCGWHVSGQIKLFAVLDPGEIGITLGESCLMDPLKSVSGVMVAGPPAIHDFAIDFDFCAACTDHACRDRIDQVHIRSQKES